MAELIKFGCRSCIYSFLMWDWCTTIPKTTFIRPDMDAQVKFMVDFQCKLTPTGKDINRISCGVQCRKTVCTDWY